MGSPQARRQGFSSRARRRRQSTLAETTKPKPTASDPGNKPTRTTVQTATKISAATTSERFLRVMLRNLPRRGASRFVRHSRSSDSSGSLAASHAIPRRPHIATGAFAEFRFRLEATLPLLPQCSSSCLPDATSQRTCCAAVVKPARLLAGVIAVLVAVATGVAVVNGGPNDELAKPPPRPLPWSLASVSNDARTLGVLHEVPSCTRRRGPVSVVETRSSVSITLSQRRVRSREGQPCILLRRFTVSRVPLRRPLATRRLRQPPRPTAARTQLNRVTALAAQGCGRFRAVPMDAAARDVPWVSRRIASCADGHP